MNFFTLLTTNNIDGLEFFLQTHDVNEEVDGQSLLYWAVFLNHLPFTKKLVEKGAVINQKDILGRTPLHIACFYGFTEIAEFLLEHGAEIDGTCYYRAQNGWDGYVQHDILTLLEKYDSTDFT